MSKPLRSSLLLTVCGLAVFAAPADAGSRCDEILAMIDNGATTQAIVDNMRRGGVDLELVSCLADNGAPAAILALGSGLAAMGGDLEEVRPAEPIAEAVSTSPVPLSRVPAHTPPARPAPRVRPRPSPPPVPSPEPSPDPSPPMASAYHHGPPGPAPTVYAPLRAGMTDDNIDFGSFLEFLASEPAGGTDRLKLGDRKWITVLDATGSPVPDARVEVLDRARDRVVWRGRSYGDGTTAFYANQEGVQGDMLVQVRGAGDYEAVRWSGQGDLRVQLDKKQAVVQRVPVDVALIIDTTGSMGDEIEQIKSTILAVSTEVERLQRPVDLRWGAVLYRDRGDEYVTREIPFTGDVTAFEAEIRRVGADGGGDGPESLNAGMHAAVHDLDWRRKAARVGFLVADAEPHMDYQNDVSYARTAQKAHAAGIKIHTVAASGLSKTGSVVFRQIAQFTRGKFIFIEYGSLGASAASHGISGPVEGNNLDRILFERIEEEVDNYGDLPDAIAGF